MADYAKGDVLVALRKKTGLSRERAAAEIGVTTKTLFTWEKENGGIRLENARRLAEFYGVDDPSTLLTSTEDGGDQLDRIETKLDEIIRLLRPDVGGEGRPPAAGPIAPIPRDDGGRAPQSHRRQAG